ncbi:uncharacterized protein BXZ73DRAFT_107490 [Epithele typhae]|uniref:uncharacterized protein n=1 Tax=Epithele typhae TaxID=378194 RepID=UPI0020084370|nr:uncharacterized protein BXZ73DRAFT_107819 [Epithele typhae]XP_047871830.1 uncharacterized protein BXZ73DRAFT_107490 [Epithele typhae]KAH9911770.1 hypothetical protein BXZ73DRAFT_107819 [Epithele typhae]KAH9912358.1 hypothetical protein BXZ73DRAFT_107490 [Epithele typhae]
MADPTDTKSAPLALPAPTPAEEEPEVPEVQQPVVNGGQTFRFDKLGPVVVNSDGTLSRIANWESLTARERETTVRVLLARNRVRLAEQAKKEGQAEGEEALSMSTDG